MPRSEDPANLSHEERHPKKRKCRRPGEEGHGGGSPALEVGEEGNPAVSSRQQGTTDLKHWLLQESFVLLLKNSMKCLQLNQVYIQVNYTDKKQEATDLLPTGKGTQAWRGLLQKARDAGYQEHTQTDQWTCLASWSPVTKACSSWEQLIHPLNPVQLLCKQARSP